MCTLWPGHHSYQQLEPPPSMFATTSCTTRVMSVPCASVTMLLARCACCAPHWLDYLRLGSFKMASFKLGQSSRKRVYVQVFEDTKHLVQSAVVWSSQCVCMCRCLRTQSTWCSLQWTATTSASLPTARLALARPSPSTALTAAQVRLDLRTCHLQVSLAHNGLSEHTKSKCIFPAGSCIGRIDSTM